MTALAPHEPPHSEGGRSNRVAVITGGASGIGGALALAYARAGVIPVIGFYPEDPHDPADLLDEISRLGGRALAVPVDVRERSQVDALFHRAIEEFGAVDIAVAGAGILRRSPIVSLDDNDWEDMLSVDLAGVMRTFRAAAAVISEGGAMVAISSIAGGVYGWEDHSHYAAAKAGVLGLCRSLAVELAPNRVRVNAVIPGLIESPQSLDEKNSLGKAGLERSKTLIPLRRIGTGDDVAHLIRFLTSDESSYITGQEFIIDGGLTIQWPSLA